MMGDVFARDGDVVDPAALQAVRQLSPAQRRYLARLPEFGFNVLRIEGCRRSTVRTLDGLSLIERGRYGLHDARLTGLGRQARSIVRRAPGISQPGAPSPNN